jgi:lipopolysaccharide export LptBFGC system permease protein LptF
VSRRPRLHRSYTCSGEDRLLIPISALYCLFTILVAAIIFVLLYRKRGLKHALVFSLLSLVILTVLFIAFITYALNAMG